MFVHLALEGISDGPLGVALDVVHTAARVVRARLAPCNGGKNSLFQRVVSLDGAPVRTSSGRTLLVDGALSVQELRRNDVLVLAGLAAANEEQIARLLERKDVRRCAQLLALAARKRVVLAASCSATFVVAASGVLDGQPATTTWWLRPSFIQRFPLVEMRDEKMVVESNRAFTAGASLAHADLMLALLSRIAGPSVANFVTKFLLLDHRASQARYMLTEYLRSTDPIVQTLETFVSANLHRQLSLEELAQAAATSPRTLARKIQAALGTTPQRFVQRLRVARAAHLLETTRESVDEIALRVGYADSSAFRRVFRRHAGESPRGARAL